MTVAAAFATEHPAHGLVEQVLGRVRGREFFLVVCVEGGGVFEIVVGCVFHDEIFCKNKTKSWLVQLFFCKTAMDI